MCLPSRNGAFDAIKSAAALSLIPLPLRAALRLKLLGCSCNLACYCEPVRTLVWQSVLLNVLRILRPPGAPSFVARRKIEEKGVQRAPKPPFGFWLFIRGFGGETCAGPTNSHWCNLRDLGSSDGVPSAVVSCGCAETKRFLFATRFAVASTASAGLLPTAPTAVKSLKLKESPTFCEFGSRVVALVSQSFWAAQHAEARE